ncbi:MAG: hypothetical protein ACK4M9_05770 [Anaerobacillus sp.]|uniref:hypothetical protein n=1 Tax=Anaerobacillus sp. TaxID=1872506 RepID=UPI00391C6BDD
MKQHNTEHELDRTFQSFKNIGLNEEEKTDMYKKLMGNINDSNQKKKKVRFFQSAIPLAMTALLLMIGGLYVTQMFFPNEQVSPGTELSDKETAINELKPTDFYEFRLVAFFEEFPYSDWQGDESLDPGLKKQFEIYEELTTIVPIDRLEEFQLFMPDSKYVEAFGVKEFPTFIGFDHTGIFFTSNELNDVEDFMEHVQQQQAMAGAIAIRTIEEFPYEIKQPTVMPFEPVWTDIDGRIVQHTSAFLNISYSDQENRMEIVIMSDRSIEDPPLEHELPLEEYQQVQLSDGTKALYTLDDRIQVLIWDDGELNYRIIIYLEEKAVEKYTITELIEIADSFE